MKTDDILKTPSFKLISNLKSTEISGFYCGEIIGNALGKLKKNQAWITSYVNINALAVAFQKNVSCIIVSEHIDFNDDFINTAINQGITVFATEKSMFDTAVLLGKIQKNDSRI